MEHRRVLLKNVAPRVINCNVCSSTQFVVLEHTEPQSMRLLLIEDAARWEGGGTVLDPRRQSTVGVVVVTHI